MEKNSKTVLGVLGVLIIFVAVISFFNSGALGLIGFGSFTTSDEISRFAWTPTLSVHNAPASQGFTYNNTNLLKQVFDENKEVRIEYSATVSYPGYPSNGANARMDLIVSKDNTGLILQSYGAAVAPTTNTSRAANESNKAFFVINKKGVYLSDISFDDALTKLKHPFSVIEVQGTEKVFVDQIEIDSIYLGHEANVNGYRVGSGAEQAYLGDAVSQVTINFVATQVSLPATNENLDTQQESIDTTLVPGTINTPENQLVYTVSNAVGKPINLFLITLVIVLVILGGVMVWYSRRN